MAGRKSCWPKGLPARSAIGWSSNGLVDPKRGPSRLLPPAPLLTRLPIGRIETRCLDGGPVLAGCSHCLFVLAVEQQNDALIALRIGGHWRTVDQESNRRCVGVAVGDCQ